MAQVRDTRAVKMTEAFYSLLNAQSCMASSTRMPINAVHHSPDVLNRRRRTAVLASYIALLLSMPVEISYKFSTFLPHKLCG